jgi:hypothetical protein
MSTITVGQENKDDIDIDRRQHPRPAAASRHDRGHVRDSYRMRHADHNKRDPT